MRLFQASWLLGMLTYVLLALLTRSWSPLSEMSFGIQTPALILLLLLPAGIGTVLGVMSLNRERVKVWWSIGVIALNLLMLVSVLIYSIP